MSNKEFSMESFISWCDDMKISNEGFNGTKIFQKLINGLKNIGKMIIKLINKLKNFIRNVRKRYNEKKNNGIVDENGEIYKCFKDFEYILNKIDDIYETFSKVNKTSLNIATSRFNYSDIDDEEYNDYIEDDAKYVDVYYELMSLKNMSLNNVKISKGTIYQRSDINKIISDADNCVTKLNTLNTMINQTLNTINNLFNKIDEKNMQVFTRSIYKDIQDSLTSNIKTCSLAIDILTKDITILENYLL
jgi:methyl-accepting chemotaxis protein